MTIMNILFEELHPTELDKIMKRKLVFVPFGLIEWHGFHLPIGNDEIKAYEICKRVAKKTNGVVLPPTFWGIHGVDFIKSKTRKHDGTLRIKVETFKMLVADIYETLIYQGFKTIVVLTGHYSPAQVLIVKKIANKFMKKYKGIKIIALAEYQVYPNQEAADHAAKWETSIMWELRPELVKIKWLDDKLLGLSSWEHPENLDPRKTASKKLGKETVSIIVNNLASFIREVQGKKHFRNETKFEARILARLKNRKFRR